MIRFEVPGPPMGKGRPRFSTKTGRAYTPARTESAESLVRLAWLEAGEPRVETVAAVIDVELVLARPAGHFLRDGTLSAAGKRVPFPTRKPDVDNALKLVMDALNGLAYQDDVQVLHATVLKRWAAEGETPHTVVMIIEKEAAV